MESLALAEEHGGNEMYNSLMSTSITVLHRISGRSLGFVNFTIFSPGINKSKRL